ncbi:MAG TPA: 3'-5' exonuclease [Rhizomicrobium sp.]|jgi:inhibitor of KinA sporulation pathway (predicted exonuclease)
MIRPIDSVTAHQLTIFDLEFTAWDGSLARHWLAPGEFKEVVQIGAVRIGEDFAILEGFDCLVRPRFNFPLSDYFENLTGISERRLSAEGVDFEEAYRRFLAFAGDSVIAAFGRDDWVLEENIRLYGLKDVPPLPSFRNLRDWFDAQGFDTSRLHSCDIGPLLGIPFEGREHDALCDARSIAAGMAVLVKRGAKLW